MSSFITLEELLADESPELRAQMVSRGREAVRAEALRQLRALARKKQDEVEGMRQDGVSRLESRNDMLLSSLNAYVRGLGGKLKIVAELPDVGPVELEITPQSKVKGATAAVLRQSKRVAPRKASPKRKSA
jgi:hypothetical protein